jgi:hypothetical protein
MVVLTSLAWFVATVVALALWRKGRPGMAFAIGGFVLSLLRAIAFIVGEITL